MAVNQLDAHRSHFIDSIRQLTVLRVRKGATQLRKHTVVVIRFTGTGVDIIGPLSSAWHNCSVVVGLSFKPLACKTSFRLFSIWCPWKFDQFGEFR